MTLAFRIISRAYMGFVSFLRTCVNCAEAAFSNDFQQFKVVQGLSGTHLPGGDQAGI